jgi:hypothetical protein
MIGIIRLVPSSGYSGTRCAPDNEVRYVFTVMEGWSCQHLIVGGDLVRDCANVWPRWNARRTIGPPNDVITG